MRMNKVIFSGRLCRDPETRRTGSGESVTNITLAQDSRKKDGDKWVDGDPIFLDVVIWGSRGEAFARHHKKGDMTLIEGRLRLDQWDDRETGAKRSKLRVDALDWHFAKSDAREPAGAPGPDRGGAGGADDTPF